MRLAVAATPHVAIPTLEFLHSRKGSLVRIFTTEDKAIGRGRSLTPSDVALWANEHGVECIKVGKASGMADHLVDIDCVITVAFGILLPEEILSIPTHGFINLHFSLLPAWRGAAPVQRAIENGDENLGISVFSLDKGMDTGPVYITKEVNISEDDTTPILLDRLTELAIPDLLDLVSKIGKTRATPQPLSGATLAPKISKDMGRIIWKSSIETVLRQDRSLSDNPGIWTMFND